MQGMNQNQIIKNLIEQTDEFDYYDNEREGIKRVMFCGVPCGLNFEYGQKNGTTIVTSILLLTSLQDKATFDNLKSSISKKYGNPDLEEYEREKLRKMTVDITESADGIMEKYCYVMHIVMKVGYLFFYIQPPI
jgi:hypothetical protein